LPGSTVDTETLAVAAASGSASRRPERKRTIVGPAASGLGDFPALSDSSFVIYPYFFG
jgi:hypothetical protein